jgi:hypothetical protein
VLIDAAQQGSAFGVQLPQPGVLEPQLLGFALDLFGFFLDLFDLELDPAYGSPIEHR